MQSNALARYLDGRERVLGAVQVHRDPNLAVEMLAAQLGGRDRTARWLLEVLDALGYGFGEASR